MHRIKSDTYRLRKKDSIQHADTERTILHKHADKVTKFMLQNDETLVKGREVGVGILDPLIQRHFHCRKRSAA